MQYFTTGWWCECFCPSRGVVSLMNRVRDCDERVGFMASASPLTGRYLPLSILYYFPISTFGGQYLCRTSFEVITEDSWRTFCVSQKNYRNPNIFHFNSSSLPFLEADIVTLEDLVLCELHLVRIKLFRPNFCNVCLFLTSWGIIHIP